MSRILLSRVGAVATITLDRPEKRNALDRETAEALDHAICELGDEADVRAIALRGAGEDFCAGADLEALERLLEAGGDASRQDAAALAKVFRSMREVPQPIVAIVHGRALAGGAGLATACDLVLAHENAQFGYPEVRIGFVPAMVMTMLRRAVGEKHAFDLVATGRLVDAREAERLGLVSRVLGAGDFEADAVRVLEDLAKSPPGAVCMTKRLFYGLDSLSFADSLALGIATNVEARARPEFREGLERFRRRKERGS